MERYRNFVRIEQMKEHIRSGRIDRALELADMLKPASVKGSSDLNIMADLYLENGMLAKAGECLGVLYERKKTRSVLMQLINLTIRLKKANEAEKYYREFKALAPGDFYNYIFRYNIDKIEGKPYDVLIGSLEKLKEVEYIESWAYELAKLYHKAGNREKCINECNDIEVWFGEGEYVDRARALKAYYAGDLDLDSRIETETTAPAYKRAVETESRLEETVPEVPDEGEPEGEMKEIEPENESENLSAAEAEDEAETGDAIEKAPEAESEDAIEEESEGEADAEAQTDNVFTAAEEDSEEVTGEAEVKTVDEAEPETEENSETENRADSVFAATAVETGTEQDDVQETEMTLEDFDDEDITLAPEVLAEIEGVGADDYEAPPVNIGDIEAEPMRDDSKRYELEAFEEAKSSKAEQDKSEPEKAEQDAAEYADVVIHEFNGIKSAELPEDGFLANFLDRQQAGLETYFGFFAYQSEVRAQLIKSLEILLNPQIKNINIVISGDRDSGVNNVIRGVAKILYQSGYLKSGQIAFTDAEKVNSMKLSQKTDKLMGCCLAIASAGSLNSDAAGELQEADKVFGGKTAVILTDYRSEISRLLRDNRELNSIFPQRIHVPEFDADDLVDLAFVKFNKEGYSIEKKAYELMTRKLRSIAREKEGVLRAAERYIEAIADSVETRKARSLMSGNFEMTEEAGQNVITVADIEAVNA